MSGAATASTPAAPRRDDYEGRGRFQGGLLRRLLSFVVPHKGLLAAALCLFPLVAGAQLLQPMVIKEAVDGPIRRGALDEVARYGLLYLGLVLGHAVLQFAQSVVMQLMGQRAMRDIRSRLFERVVTLAPSYFDKTPQGKILTRMTGDVQALNEFISSGLVSVIADTILLLGIVGVMLYLDWRLALVSFCLLPLLVFGVAWLRGRMRQLFRAIRNRNTALNTYLNESIIGMVIVQAFRREAVNRRDYEAKNDALLRETLKGVWLSSTLSAAVQLAQILTVALLLWAVLERWFGITASVGLVIAFVDYTQRFYGPVDNLSGRYTILQTALASAEKIFALLDEREELPRAPDPVPVPPLREGIRLDGVSFHYVPGSPVLRNVTLEIPRGHTVALVGATGAGKSTIVKLLGRFYDPTAGAVRWDGHDLRSFELRALRKRIAYVPQETFLFSDTLERNIALDPERVPPERVRAAAEAVHASGVAEDLPRGYDQLLGERGHDLSAGERQLVSFARALAHDPELLILDEATATIDGETEERIQTALETLLAGRTAVVIAHRLSTIKKADRIVVLHKGEVKETGTHEELLARRGLYWKLYRLQSEEAA
ncbi:MAG: ABC transporter ATP-binding protein [Planctomycetota bacterium]|nr:MAG: ABC transporter ATP-binding protein [Planctomycetota bacterium]